MLLLLHALIPCLGACNILPSSSVLLHINIVPSFPVLLHIYTALVSLLFATVIPTSFNILMLKGFYSCFLLYRNSRMPYCVSIKPYNSTVHEFCAVQLRLYGRVGARHFQSQLSKYARWRAGILRKKPAEPENRVDQHL